MSLSENAARRTNPVQRFVREQVSDVGFWPKVGVPLGFVAMCVFFATQSSGFLTLGNVGTIFQQASTTGIAAIGATIVLLGGNLDISQGSTMATSGLVAVMMLNEGVPVGFVIIVALVVGMAVGALISVLVVSLNVPSFIASLGAMVSVRGFAFVLSGGIGVAMSPGVAPAIVTIGQGRFLNLPIPAIIMVILFAVFALLMTQTVWGVRIAALGSSEDATRLAGVKPAGIVYSTFMVAGALSAISGLMLVGLLNAAAPGTANDVEFDVLTAVVLGGASIYGGKASVLRTLLGAIFVVTLYNGMILLGVPTFYQMVANGLVLIGALALNQVGTRSQR